MKAVERWPSLRRAPWLAYRLLTQGRYDFVYDRMALSVRGMSAAKRRNLAAAGLNLIYRRARPWAMPLHMQLELASTCNLHCPICPTGSGELGRPGGFMDPALFARVWAEVGPYLLTASLWGWGESLLHPELAELLRVARGQPVVTLLSTNGQNLDRNAIVDALLAHPPTFLIVALDGLSDETNAGFRLGARLAPALDGIRRLARLKAEQGQRFPVLHMRTIVMKHNQHEIASARAFAAEHGFDMLTLRALVPVSTPTAARRFAGLLPDLDKYRAYRPQVDPTLREEPAGCVQPFWFPSLYADGTLVACEQDACAACPLGKITRESTFAELWWSEEAACVRRRMRDHPHEIPCCRDCPLGHGPGLETSVEVACFAPALSPLVVQGEVP